MRRRERKEGRSKGASVCLTLAHFCSGLWSTRRRSRTAKCITPSRSVVSLFSERFPALLSCSVITPTQQIKRRLPYLSISFSLVLLPFLPLHLCPSLPFSVLFRTYRSRRKPKRWKRTPSYFTRSESFSAAWWKRTSNSTKICGKNWGRCSTPAW